jgi:hypothetical protein
LALIHPLVAFSDPSEIELALAKPVRISKKFCLLDVVAPSHGLHIAGLSAAHASEHAA